MGMGYYNYCRSLLVEFWMIPFQVDYPAVTKHVARGVCGQCRQHTFGSVLYGVFVAFLGFGASLYDIYYLISPYNEERVKAPRLNRDLQLMIGTISTLVYLTLMLGMILENPHLLLPWLFLETVSIILLVTQLQGYSRLLLLALSINNFMQIGCVFLKFLKIRKTI